MWRGEINQLRKRLLALQDQENLVAFYGSSSIRLWEHMSEDLKPFNTINLGFGGSTYKYCSHYFEELFEGIDLQEIILYAGDNDLSKLSARQTIQDFKELYNKVFELYSTRRISVISVKPSPEKAHLQESIKEVNAAIGHMLKINPKGTFIDVFSMMLDSQDREREELYLEDQLHMNENGYEIWKAVVGRHLRNNQK
ncbi:MAG: GDSL-type esterase/lipase family protein [Bacteroidota bacterium]